MKTRVYTTIHAVIALILFSAVVALSQTEHQHDSKKPSQSTQSKKPMQHDMSKMDMSRMMNEPHHSLAVAYMQNIATFAKTLHNQAQESSPLDVKFARAAVAEIRRSFDQMGEHHGEHMKMMSEEMRSHMAAMMKDMETHRSMLKDAVSALEKDVQTDQPVSKQVAADSANVIKHIDEMSKMHNEQKGKKMKM